MEHLYQLSETALKAYVYLCSCNHGGPITASIDTICQATGQKRRAIITALKTLDTCKLIHRNTGTGNQPNGYQVLISGSSPSGNSKQVTSEATTIPLLVKDSLANGITRLGKSPLLAVKTVSPSVKGPSQSAAPPRRKASLVELIAICYRQIDSRELAELRSRFPDEASLVAKLESLSCRGDGVAPEMSLGFLAACLEKLG